MKVLEEEEGQEEEVYKDRLVKCTIKIQYNQMYFVFTTLNLHK